MTLEDVVACLNRCRIVDLSKKLTPGNADGPAGSAKRKYEIKEFIYPPGELMHYIDMESHISTHVEAPSHYIPVRYGRKDEDVSEVSLSKFFGRGVLVNCKDLPPKTPIGRDLLKKFGVRQGDIVLVGNSPFRGVERCKMVKEGAEYLAELKIKMLGFDDTVSVENPELQPKDLKTYFTHDLMLSNGIPVIEQVANLGDLSKPRFLFFGFPARMGGLESFPIRAVALEVEE